MCVDIFENLPHILTPPYPIAMDSPLPGVNPVTDFPGNSTIWVTWKLENENYPWMETQESVFGMNAWSEFPGNSVIWVTLAEGDSVDAFPGNSSMDPK